MESSEGKEEGTFKWLVEGKDDGSSKGKEEGASKGREDGSGSLPSADFIFVDFYSFNFASFKSNLLDFVPVVPERFTGSISVPTK